MFSSVQFSHSVVSDSVQPRRRQPTRLLRPWDSPSKTLEWVATSFSNTWKWKVKVKSLSPVWLFATPWTIVCQAHLSMGFSRQKYWSGLPFPPLGDLPEPRIGAKSPATPALSGTSFTTKLPRKPILSLLLNCCKVASVVSDSVQPRRWQPTRLPHPWDSPGKNTGVGCHFVL